MSMSADRSTLALPAFDDDLDDFAPRGIAPAPAAKPEAAREDAHPAPKRARAERSRGEVRAVSRCPGGDVARDGQLNLKGPIESLDRVRALCKADRRAYYDMLEILMDHYEGKAPEN